MLSHPLSHLFTRCYGDGCPEKEQCLRFTTMRHDPPALLSYTLSLRRHPNETCEGKLNGDDSGVNTV
jgi:hypothetical protein